MLTRHEVLNILKAMGAQGPSQLKAYLRTYERYMEVNYGLRVLKSRNATAAPPEAIPSSAGIWRAFPRTRESLSAFLRGV